MKAEEERMNPQLGVTAAEQSTFLS